eukprot:CAMPEP_0201868634 /NCGR_PEP_ID=MMETSP0902-20130614/2430_1 /ASSEMBLY_ACC=CAM_ASM_000551 /TAXON_ID=420261 /ORGANISM="Thalassiosira antarctica, Strain CCMP982" /LENGTH=101 /DNA_ID=CAMNT_0048393993 /DNA_START=181 /DNA_END=486 /DNA_ORIENTATION=+
MTTGFSTAADWLQINNQIEKKDASKDPILRDLRVMKDVETRDGVHNAPKYNARGVGNCAVPMQLRSKQQQPKPKFVAHKDPTPSKKGKDKVKSNRLGKVVG